MVWWHILWWAAFAFGGSCCFAAAVEYHPMLYCVQCCCCRVHFVYNQSTEYTETICMHLICTNLLRHTICALYLCKVCSAQRIRIVDFSAHVALFVCVSYSATSRLCLQRWPSPAWERWASSAPALQGGGTLRELWNHQTTNSSWAAVVPVKSHWGFLMEVVAFSKRNLFQDHRPFAFRLVRYQLGQRCFKGDTSSLPTNSSSVVFFICKLWSLRN